MHVDTARVAPPDSRPIYHLIRRTRNLLRATWAGTGLALTVGLCLGALAVVTAADLLLPLIQIPYVFAYPLDGVLRSASLFLVTVPPAAVFLVGVIFPLCRRLTAGEVARRIEGHIPGIHNRLVSCIDLETRGRTLQSPVFYRRLLGEALDRIRAFRPSEVLNFAHLRRAGVTAAAGVIAFAVVACVFFTSLPTALARIFRPLDDIPPAAAVAYRVEPRGGDFLREEKIDFSAEVTRGEIAALKLELRADNGAVKEMDFEAGHDDPSLFKLELDTVSLGQAFQDGFHYRVHGGGTWSKRYDVRLVERPLITNVDTAVYYPAYMGIPEPHPTAREASEVNGPEGGDIEVAVRAEGQVAEGAVQLLRPGTRQIPARDQEEHVWFGDKAPADSTEGGTWDREKKEKRSAHTEPFATGHHAHWFHDDPAGLAVQPGDVLFTWVFVDPQAPPDEIMLEWNDGVDWEHRAAWGADEIGLGKPGTASRRPAQPMPDGGAWVRLDVPAAAVGLEGKTLHGMAFRLNGGQCWWGKSGTVRTEEPTFLVEKSFPMKSDEPGLWVGRLPLVGKGFFRAELRNEHGQANKPMNELRFAAMKDQPPQVVLQRPGPELILSQPQAPPLTILAFDDYGLDDVTLYFRGGEAEPYQVRTLQHFDRPERSQTIVAPLQEAAELKQGGQLRYFIQATDRKGQKAYTPEYVVRIAADPNAADKQEAAFDKTQDAFRDHLLKLIAEQKKVQTNVEQLSSQYAEMADKVRKDQAATEPPPSADPKTPPPPPQDGPKIDPETAKKLAEIQKQLAQLAQEENKNTQDAAQLNNDLVKANEAAEKLQTLPPAVLDQMQALQQAFEQTAVKGMENLTQHFDQGANPQAGAPDLKGLEHKADRLAKDLDGIKDRMEALDNARKNLRDDLAAAIQELQREMLNEDGKLSERDLQDLRDFIAKMRDQLKDLQGQQENLLNDSANGGDLKDTQAKQADLDKQLEKMLGAARKMLDAKRRPNRHKPTFPDEPYTPDDEVKVPPREADTDEPLPNAKKPAGEHTPGDKKPDEAKDDDDKEPLDMPALGGPKQVPDERFDKKRRKAEKKPGEKDDPDAQRDDLEDHQNDRLRDLDAAQKSLASDQQSVEQMLRSVEQAMKANDGQKGQKSQNPGQPAEDDAMQQLRQMLQSSAMQQARSMLQRMQRGQGSKAQQASNRPSTPSKTATSQSGATPAGNADLSKLPPDQRAAFLKLPPRVREELLQALNEKGPEGYGPFIDDYFKRLTESKSP